MRNILTAFVAAAVVSSSMMAIPASALADNGVVALTAHDVGTSARPCLFFYLITLDGWASRTMTQL